MSMERANPARMPVVVAGVFALLAVGLFFARPAHADCGGVLSTVNGTAAGGPLCGSPSPSPSPTPTPSPTHKPTPSPHPTTQATYPPFTFPTPAPFPTTFPYPTPNGDQQLLAMQRLQQQLQDQLRQNQSSQLFEGGGFATAPGLAGAHPNGSDAGFLARAATLLLIGTAGAMWMWRARVRRWMVGG